MAMGRIVPPDGVADRRAMPIERRELVAIDVNSMLAPIPVAPAPERLDDRRAEPSAAEGADRRPVEKLGKIVRGIGRIWPRP